MAIVKTGKIYILYIYYTMLASPVLIVYMKLYSFAGCVVVGLICCVCTYASGFFFWKERYHRVQ